MSAVTVNVAVTGMDEQSAAIRALISGLESRRELHALIADRSTIQTQQHVAANNGHATATKLGATPTGFRRKSAERINAVWDESAAIVVIPANTGLGRAFHDVDIIPKKSGGFLTIPADARTYGKSARDFPEGTFEFGMAMENGRAFKALIFVADKKPGYWLRRKVHQKQNRDLLPSDEAYQALARETSIEYINSILERTAA